jgi:hypothetical protein
MWATQRSESLAGECRRLKLIRNLPGSLPSTPLATLALYWATIWRAFGTSISSAHEGGGQYPTQSENGKGAVRGCRQGGVLSLDDIYGFAAL